MPRQLMVQIPIEELAHMSEAEADPHGRGGQAMSIPIEELARMSEGEAVRRHFDERNTKWIAAPLFVSAALAVIFLMALLAGHKATERRAILIFSNLALVFATTA